MWHDHSTVANHGHLVFMVSCIYDPALYLTPEEYLQRTGKWVDIQSQVEKPEIYIIGRCKSSDVEQLAYVETRCDCLGEMANHIEVSPGVPVTDVMRFFKGDGPAVAFETGLQKGGHFFCSICGVHAVMCDELDHVFRCKHISLHDKQNLVLGGPLGKKNSLAQKPKPLQGLKKEELQVELEGRGTVKDATRMLKPDLEKELATELRGVQRVPALLYSNPSVSFESLNLQSYEALGCEPMHDISNHIANVLEELPNHLKGEAKSCPLPTKKPREPVITEQQSSCLPRD